MSIDTVGLRFSEALEDIFGKTNNKKVAEKYNITQQSVGQLKKKKALNETISFICANESINLNWIQTGKGEMLLEDNNKPLQEQQISNDNLVEITYYEDIVASAGGGAYNHQHSAPTLVAFDRNFLKTHLGLSTFENIHIITSTGDSMEPTISAGELLFISPIENESSYIKEGGIYIIMCEDTVLVKRVSKDNINKEITLISDNTIYPPRIIKLDDFNNCKILGRVIGHFNGL
ncbi:S24 family peptidase [Sulfurimonas sp.]|uniref:S24 family peptidase n=1 Tax=Sulfurimonas sp. TaxID=2022749 RepID=UPI003D13CE50